jgi:4-hydroxy-3-polyprenylbenzoate decarboxylase
MRLVVGITGASGAIYGVRLLEVLRQEHPAVETYLVISEAAALILPRETHYTLGAVRSLAGHCYDDRDLAAPIASGSFPTDGMVNSYSDTLIARTGDVALKERRKLILLVRETPLHAGHLRLMLALAELGAVILPPVPAFYTLPTSVDDIISHAIGRTLEQLGLEHSLYPPWQGWGAQAPSGGA